METAERVFRGSEGEWECISLVRTKGEPEVDSYCIQTDDEHITLVGNKNNNSLANAKLIAAAPELLQALQECIERLEAYAQVWGYDEQKMVSKAESAIEKALG